jgi:hypothetical protein
MAKHHRAEHPEHEPPADDEDEAIPPEPPKEEPADPDAPPKTQVITY